MKKEEILKLFWKFLSKRNKKINLNNLVLTPKYNESKQKIFWYPNTIDVSFAKSILKGHIEDLVEKFCKLTSETFYNKLITQQEVIIPFHSEFNLTSSDYHMIMTILGEIKSFNYDDFIFKIKPIKYKLNYIIDKYGEVEMVNKITYEISDPRNTVTGEKLTISELRNKLEFLNEENDFVDRLDELFYPTWWYLAKERPALIDKHHTIISIYVTFLTKDGSEIRYY